MRIECKGISPERAIRILRRKLDANGFKDRIRELEFYEKPTSKRKRKKAQAIKRQQKLTNEMKRFELKRPRNRR